MDDFTLELNDGRSFPNLSTLLKTYWLTQGVSEAVKDLEEHVEDTLAALIEKCPQQALKRFEEVSYLIKEEKSGRPDAKTVDDYFARDERNYKKMFTDLLEF